MAELAHLSLGFWESAVTACDRALALDPVCEAPHRIKLYFLTRLGELDASRLALDELARVGSSPLEVTIARFDLRIAEGDFAGAHAGLADSAFPPGQEDRRQLASALVQALLGQVRDARQQLDAVRSDGPRFWDHSIRLALALGEEEQALELLLGNPISRSYRWLATESLVRPYLHRPRWRALADELHGSWRKDLEEVGPRLPAPPPAQPEPADLGAALRRATGPSLVPGATSPEDAEANRADVPRE